MRNWRPGDFLEECHNRNWHVGQLKERECEAGQNFFASCGVDAIPFNKSREHAKNEHEQNVVNETECRRRQRTDDCRAE